MPMGTVISKTSKHCSSAFGKTQFEKEDFTISVDELNAGLRKCNYKAIDRELAKLIIKYLVHELQNKNEASMLLAHMIHETGGFEYKEEQYAVKNPEEAQKRYNDENGIKGKSYHGRGFIMLSYPTNYKSASIDLGLGDELLRCPEMIVESNDLCIQTALWYWNKVVKKSRNVCDSNFNASTLEINGALETSGEGLLQAKHRLELYQNIAGELGITNISKK